MLGAVRAIEKGLDGIQGKTPEGRVNWPARDPKHGGSWFVSAALAVAFIATALQEGGAGSEFRALLTIALWMAVIAGLAFGLWPRTTIPRTALLTGGALAGLALLSGLSALWASDDGLAFSEFIRVAAYLGVFTCIVLASTPGSARLWLRGLTIGIVVVALLGLLARLFPDLFPASDLAESIPDAAQRLSYPLDYWNAMGLVGAVGLLLLASTATTGATRAARAGAVATLPAVGLALFLTSSRGGLAAFTLGAVVLLVLDRDRTRVAAALVVGSAGALALAAVATTSDALIDGRTADAAITGQAARLLLLTIAVGALVGLLWSRVDAHPARLELIRRLGVGIVAILVLGVLAAGNPIDRVSGFCDIPAVSTEQAGAVTRHLSGAGGGGRCQFWGAALDAYASSPFVGIGAGGYQSWWGEHATLALYIRNAHSLFLEQLAELGPLGLTLILGFLGVPLLAGLRRRRDQLGDAAVAPAMAVVVTVAAASAIDWMWETPAAFGPGAICAALLAGPALSPAGSGARNRFEIGIATLAVAWVIVLAASASLFTEVKLGASRDAVDAGRLDDAAELAREARTLQPWSAEPRLQEAQVEELRGDSVAARSALDEALERAPEDWRIWLVDARLRAAAGDPLGSLESTNRSNRLRPKVPAPR